MGKFSLYNVPLKNLTEGTHSFEYLLDDKYFKLIGDSESDIERGTVKVDVAVKRISNTFEFGFALSGTIIVPCDRCLDDMSIDVDVKNRLVVKFGEEYAEESDEIVVIPEEEGAINIAWFLYEFVTLAIPMKHVHAPGKCNKIMTSKYNKHKAVSADDDDSDDIDDSDEIISETEDLGSEVNDPRWDALKNLSIDEE